jgi:hypothetical protein
MSVIGKLNGTIVPFWMMWKLVPSIGIRQLFQLLPSFLLSKSISKNSSNKLGEYYYDLSHIQTNMKITLITSVSRLEVHLMNAHTHLQKVLGSMVPVDLPAT